VETVFERVGALDVNKAQVTACVRVPDATGRRAPQVAVLSDEVCVVVVMRSRCRFAVAA
jgi:hypothetical protein